jgi:DNA-binding protein YbaB
MSNPLSDVERMVDHWERDAEENASRYTNMRQEVEQISITESAADGAIEVTVGHNGIPTKVAMTDAVSRMRPSEIAAAVMQAMKRAQSRYPAELARIMGETVGDDTTTRYLLEAAERNFPTPEPEETKGQRRFGFEDDEDVTPARPVSRRRPPDDDGGDFSDQSFVR